MTEAGFEIFETNGIRLRVALAGNVGPLVVLVHGFPESWYSWRHQIPALAAAGYRVAAPDVRGYGGSDKPQPVEAYAIKEMCADIAGLVTALGETLAEARRAAYEAVGKIQFQGAFYRRDIGEETSEPRPSGSGGK